jgi:uncharacterized membrane protein
MKEFIIRALTINIEQNLPLGLMIGLISYLALYIGKGVQKLAIEGIKSESIRSRHTGIWIAGTILTALPVFIQWAALAFAPMNLIAPLEGFGLLGLLCFSLLVLKEKITKRSVVGSVHIIVGTALVALFSSGPPPIGAGDLSTFLLLIIITPLLTAETAAILISKRHGYRFAGPIIGFTAGTCMALQTFFKRVSMIPDVRIIAAVCVFIFTPLTLVVTQFGFVKAKANEVVPLFTSGSIIIASILGVFTLNERMLPAQIAGIGLIIAGILLLTTSENAQVVMSSGTGGKETTGATERPPATEPEEIESRNMQPKKPAPNAGGSA